VATYIEKTRRRRKNGVRPCGAQDALTRPPPELHFEYGYIHAPPPIFFVSHTVLSSGGMWVFVLAASRDSHMPVSGQFHIFSPPPPPPPPASAWLCARAVEDDQRKYEGIRTRSKSKKRHHGTSERRGRGPRPSLSPLLFNTRLGFFHRTR